MAAKTKLLTSEEKIDSIKRNFENWEVGLTSDNLLISNIRKIVEE